ncbi:hypothetical protein KEQ38_22900 [Escherichia coli]|nr:hypothetical protein [Escherichia coli]HBC1799484.1 hypothetical protein [Escherichia coli]
MESCMKLNKNNITYLAKHIFPIYFRDESSYTLSFICKKRTRRADALCRTALYFSQERLDAVSPEKRMQYLSPDDSLATFLFVIANPITPELKHQLNEYLDTLPGQFIRKIKPTLWLAVVSPWHKKTAQLVLPKVSAMLAFYSTHSDELEQQTAEFLERHERHTPNRSGDH